MAALRNLFAWLAGMVRRLDDWSHDLADRWEDRHIDKYNKQVAEALFGAEKERKRRDAAKARRL